MTLKKASVLSVLIQCDAAGTTLVGPALHSWAARARCAGAAPTPATPHPLHAYTIKKAY